MDDRGAKPKSALKFIRPTRLSCLAALHSACVSPLGPPVGLLANEGGRGEAMQGHWPVCKQVAPIF